MRYIAIVVGCLGSGWVGAQAQQLPPAEASEPSTAAHAGYPVMPRAVDAAVLVNLRADARTAGLDIDVEADRRNVVTLTGKVASEQEKSVAAGIAARTSAVTEVRNELVVRQDD